MVYVSIQCPTNTNNQTLSTNHVVYTETFSRTASSGTVPVPDSALAVRIGLELGEGLVAAAASNWFVSSRSLRRRSLLVACYSEALTAPES